MALPGSKPLAGSKISVDGRPGTLIHACESYSATGEYAFTISDDCPEPMRSQLLTQKAEKDARFANNPAAVIVERTRIGRSLMGLFGGGRDKHGHGSDPDHDTHAGEDSDIERRLRKLEALMESQLAESDLILESENSILNRLPPPAILSVVRIKFAPSSSTTRKGALPMAEGPITLTVGSSTIASIDGFDQNGAPFNGPIPTPSWSIDQPGFDSITQDATNPNDQDVTSLSAGVANLSVQLTNTQGTVLKDSEAITNVVPQVLTSVKINFAAPTGGASATKKA